jgi:hypothetical protein
LGDKQWKEREMTYGKIVSLLTVSPFTFEQLWKVSRIHRNTLHKRLQYLIKDGVVLVHKYAIPYTKDNYGYMYKYSVPNPYTAPLYGHKYYLLNCSDLGCSGLINFYYNNKAREAEKPLLKGLEKRSKFCAFENSIGELFNELEQYRDRVTEMNELQGREYWQKSVELCICVYRLAQKIRIAAAIRGFRLRSGPEDLSILEREKIRKVIDFFIKKGYSIMDILIRCST